MTDRERQLAALMRLGLTEEQAIEVLDCDRQIDRGANPFPLSPEQEKASKKARGVGREPTAKKPVTPGKRERKPNDVKRALIGKIVGALEPDCDEPVIVTNAEREIEFVYYGVKYKVVLSAPRK